MLSKLLLSAAVLAATSGPVLADRCEAILADGLRETFTFSDGSSFQDTVHLSVCSNRTRQSSSSNSFGASFPIEGLAAAIGLNSSTALNRSSVDQYCREGGRLVNRQAAVNWAVSVVNERAVAAWESCVAGGGLICETEALGPDRFRVTLSWDSPFPGSSNDRIAIEGAPQLVNAACPSAPIRAGATIEDDSSLAEICQFMDNSQAAYVTFNTSHGVANCQVRAPAPERTLRTDLQDCLADDTRACLSLLQGSREALDVCDTADRGNFALYIQCGNARTGIQQLLTAVADVDRACWTNTPQCAGARQTLSQTAAGQVQTVEAILSGSRALPGPVPAQ